MIQQQVPKGTYLFNLICKFNLSVNLLCIRLFFVDTYFDSSINNSFSNNCIMSLQKVGLQMFEAFVRTAAMA